MTTKIDWHQLERFRIVGRFQNVSRAAHELGTSQPALSRAIARLEERLGVPLFHRAGRSLRLTPAGTTFLRTLEIAYSTIEEAQYGLASLVGPPKPIRIGFVRTLGFRLVPSLVSDYQRRIGSEDFTFVSDNGPALESFLQKDELDLIFTVLPTRDSSLASHKIFDQELVLIAPKDRDFSSKQPAALKDFSDERFITFRKGHALRTLTDLLCNTAGFIPKVNFETSDSGSIPGFVAAGLGVSIMPSDGHLSSEVAIVPMRAPLMARQMGLAWIEGRHLHDSARAFKAYVMSLGQDGLQVVHHST